MSAATLNQLLAQIGPAHATGFFLVLARISPLFVLAPLFSSPMLAPQARGTIAVGISIGLTGVATQGQRIPEDPLAIAGLVVEQLLVGVAFAFAIGAVYAAIEVAGALSDFVAGFTFGQTLNPMNGTQGGVLSQLYGLAGVMIFIAIGGDAWMLRGLDRTFTLVPLTRAPQLDPLIGGVAQAGATILTAAVEVAAPALLAVLITDVALGVIARAMPQLNIFAVGFPLKVGISLLVVTASLPFLGGWMSTQIYGAVNTTLGALRIG
ncbi:MAG: flagellar biosynthetic protein FliR [Solirubrobacteraceae bacterium]